MRRAERRAGWWFIGPAALVLVLMLVFPLGYTAYLSFFEWFAAGGPPRFAGVANYLQLAGDARFINALVRTVLYTVLAVGAEVILGIALVWLLMFDPAPGVLTYLLTLLRLPKRLWVNDSLLAIPSLVLVDVWQWTPLVMLIVLGGLTALPREPFEAARIDGASRWQSFRYLTLPMLRPYIIVAALFRGIDALKTFDSIYVITRGGPGFASETLNLYIYASAFDYLHMGYSSAMLVVFFALILALSAALIAGRRRAG